ncbi:PAS domain S-box protein, partial [Geomonas sp.]|uniref:PAS domain-containing hybrid sensor histidine kinase/response regulator n=1 Tax=Geomonas sp. TaxID=2651584 RepID=UPI002B4800C6
MAVHIMISRMSRLLAAVIGLALVGYIGYLVVAQYRSQLALQDTALKRFTSDATRRATALSFYFSEGKSELRDLARSREISSYFENKALGMSMEHGLRATLQVVDDLFDATLKSKVSNGGPAFDRLVFIDRSGQVLADTAHAGAGNSPRQWKRYLKPDVNVVSIDTETAEGEVKFLVSAPVRFKAHYQGEVLGWLSSAKVYRCFIQGLDESSRYPTAFVFNESYLCVPEAIRGTLGPAGARLPHDIVPMVPYRMQPSTSRSGPAGYAILVPVEGTPVSMVAFVPAAGGVDVNSPRRMLYTTAGIAAFILFGLFYLQVINTRNAVLRAHLEEKTLREAAVGEKNRLLAAEIEERRQTDLTLRESRQQLLDIISFLPDATMVIDRDGKVVAWNKAIEVMSGVKAEEMIGKGDYEYAIPFYGKRRPVLIDLALHPDPENNCYGSLRNDDSIIYGETFTPHLGPDTYLAGSASVLRNSQGEVTAAIECIRDVSDRLRAERLIRESEATLRSLMDSMPAGVWWYDEEQRVEYLNSRFAELFGYQLEEIPTVNHWLVHAYPDADQRFALMEGRQKVIEQARGTGAAVPPLETMVACRDGRVRHIIVNTQFSQGRTLEIFTDITEQEFINNELLKVQKMESLGVLAGGIAHDFNNILTGIIGYLSLAQMFLEEGHAAHPMLVSAENASQRASELAYQLLTFAKGGAPNKKVVSVSHLVEEAVSLSLRGTSVQKKMVWGCTLREVEADAGQLNQAFNNIVINAVHAMPEGGTLTVRGDNVQLEMGNPFSLEPGPYVRILFEDEGCGIPEEVLKKIFDPYFTTKARGNGLGLASTLSIISKHGGHIQVHSQVGVGTTFSIYLPAALASTGDGESGAAACRLPRQAGGTVLVMDDEQMIRDLCSKMLRALGYQVATCGDGVEAIEKYR